MIVDAFMFNDEFDMLNIHLDIMSDYVDQFVILEGNMTWSGRSKPYLLSDNLKKIKRHIDKVKIIKLDIPKNLINWQCENFSRAQLNQGLKDLEPDDIIIHGDLDEIINTENFPAILDFLNQHNRPISLNLEMYAYKFNQRMSRNWTGHVVASRKMFTDPQQLYKGQNSKRKDRSHCVLYPSIVGWHWTWIGDDERVRNKVLSCIESQHRDPEQVLSAFKQLDTASAINHKCSTTTIETHYPPHILKILKNYPQYWANENA